MSTLTQIRREVLPTAAWLSPVEGPPARDPEVGWVRVLRARVPALEGLEPGDLAIVPEGALGALVAGGVDPAAVIAELTAARVSAVLLVGEGRSVPAADAMVDAARKGGMPVLRVGGAELSALERSLVGYLVNRRAELDRQAAQVDERVERLALEGHGLEALAGAIGEFLGRAVAIEDERLTTLAVHAPATIPEAAAAAARYLAQPRQVALRVPLPGSGSLALLGHAPPSDLDRAVAERVAPLLALELNRRSALRRARDAGRAAEMLPADGPPWVVLVARQIVRGEDLSTEERLRRRDRIAALAPARRLLLRGDAASLDYRVVAAIGGDDPRGTLIAGRIGAAIARDVGVSRPFARPEERSAAEAEARETLAALEALPGPGDGEGTLPRLGLAERLGAYRLLGELHELPTGPRLAAELLAPLLDGRPTQRRQRLATLRATLEHPGAAAAANALGVHRNTLLYRLARIEERTGWRLNDPDLRLALQVAVRLVGDR